MTGVGVAEERAQPAPEPIATEDRLRPSHFSYRPALDGLRAIAVLGVIAYHDNATWAHGAFLGVDTFFVLSGFLITTLLILEYRKRTTIGLGGFWGRRARRLLPALMLVLLFVAFYTHTVA